MEKALRSLIHEVLPLDLRVELELLSRRRDIINEEKQEEILTLMRNYDIHNVVPLGPGTNRYAAKIEGFVVKFATDHDGKIDNFKEFKLAKRFFPDVSKIHEVSRNGSLLVAEYIIPFQSYSEMLKYADKIREKLRRISSVYLIGDVGISSVNYANWGLRVGTDEPTCLDFAYAYEVSSELFVCRACKSGGMLVPDKDFVNLHCSACGKRYSFEDIRGRIGNDLHNHEIGDLTEEGYVMTDSGIITQLDCQRSNYLIKKLNKKKVSEDDSDIVQDPVEESFDQIDVNNKEEKTMNGQELMNHYVESKIGVTVTGAKVVDDEKPLTRKPAPIKPDKATISARVVSARVMEPDEAVPEATPAYTTSDTTTASQDGLAFSGSINNDDNTEVIEAQEVIESNVQEETEEEVYDTEDEEFDDESFLINLKDHISEVSNRVGNFVKDGNLFDTVKATIIDYNMQPRTFYKSVQNCVFRSLMMFFNFTEREVPNKSGKGTHKDFEAPTTISPETHDTLNFIKFMTMTPELSSINIDDPSIIDAFLDIYSEDMWGFQAEWIPYLKERIKIKIPVREDGVNLIADCIMSNWCRSDEAADVIDDSEGDDTEYEEEIDDGVVPEEVRINIDNNDFMVTKTFVPAPNTPDMSSEEIDDDDDEDEYESDDTEDDDYDDEATYLTVDIFPDDDFDIVRVISDDVFGSISIPFYTKLEELSIDNHKNLVDDRNGHWDWLSGMVPDLMFRCEDPEPWLRGNELECKENQTHIIILKKEDTGSYIMGIFYVGGIYIYDEGVPSANFDDDLLERLNVLLERSICITPISHLKRSISEEDIIYPEEYIQVYFSDENGDYEQVEFTGSITGNPDETEMSEMEKAAVRAAVNTVLKENETPPSVDVDYEEEVVPESVQNQSTRPQEPERRPGTFKPKRRR